MADVGDNHNEAATLIKQDESAQGPEVHPQSVPLTPSTPDGLSIGMMEHSSDGGGSDEVLPPERKKGGRNGSAARPSLVVEDSMDLSQPEGRRLYFTDGVRRIDYILAWSGKEKEHERFTNDHIRDVFEANLEKEGLELEEDFQEGRDIQYIKIHAPWPVLVRYAEVLKIRMPMKEIPEEVQTVSLWEVFTEWTMKLFKPFKLDPNEVPPLPKKFTCVFQISKEYLFAIPAKNELFFSHATRSRIVDYILRRKKYSDVSHETFNFGISRLISNGVYLAAYPLHEGSWKPWTRPSMRRLLYVHWAHWRNFYKEQPLDYIRTYFGEKIGLYFAWLGFYTWMLTPASILGLIVFIYSVATINDNIIAQETCNLNFTMCPQCDLRCPYWKFSTSCMNARSSHMFDNKATVFFAVFMSIWGTVFLEFWKREQVSIQFRWNLMNFEEEEQPPRPEYLMQLANSKHRKKHKVTGEDEPFHPFWRRRMPVYLASFSCMLSLVMLAMAVVIGVVMYRMAVLSALYLADEELFYRNASMVTTATSACINLVLILILNYLYEYIATKLTDWESLRTQSEYDNSLTIKLYVLQFVNYYSSIFYIAFFKGRFRGRPGAYNTLFGARQEENAWSRREVIDVKVEWWENAATQCQAGGCLIELAIQLAIIFVGKQLIQNNLMEIVLPRIQKRVRLFFIRDKDSSKKNRAPWEKDYILNPLGSRGLFNEYLEMLLQFGFVTIFVAAFPLAPLFALLNNIIEIRCDANKFVTQLQRPMAARSQDIGIWYQILSAVSTLAVLSNALIIAFTSGYIHREVYMRTISPTHDLNGFVNHKLSYFNVSDFPPGVAYEDPDNKYSHLQYCRYQDYREPPWSEFKYEYTKVYWEVMAAQVIFVVIFENFVMLIVTAIAYAIPDMPRKLREQVRREAFLTNEIILKTELERTRGEDMILDPKELASIRRRARGGAARSEGNASPTEARLDVNFADEDSEPDDTRV